jgi:hypothetical protein
MDEAEIVRLYTAELWTLRRIAGQFGTNHHRIRRVLNKHAIPITAKRRRPPMSEARRRQISERTKGRTSWSKGLTLPESFCRSNMKGRFGGKIDLDKYPDYPRLKFLTAILSKRKHGLGGDDASRVAFLDRFYFDEAFNAVYDAWIASGKDKWSYPSLDHKHAKSNGGDWDLDNLRFITWFENRAKAEMSVKEWDDFRRSTNTRSDLFIERILHLHRKRGGS